MPVGWRLSSEERARRGIPVPQGPATGDVLEAVAAIALFLALIALLPEFDGSRGEDWGNQPDDD